MKTIILSFAFFASSALAQDKPAMIIGDDKLPVKQTFTRKGDAAYDSVLEVTGTDGKPTQWEEESCTKVSGARAMTPNP